MSVTKHIPNALTLSNLLCGCISIALASQGHLLWAAYLIFIATLFDFADGLAARALKVQSEVGKQLDSLADLVTFGVAPGFLVFFMLKAVVLPDAYHWPNSIGGSLWINYQAPDQWTLYVFEYLPYFAFIIPLFAAIRLARFNVDDSQSEEFKGLATPANALFFAGTCVYFSHKYLLDVMDEGIGTWGLNRTAGYWTVEAALFFYTGILALCLLMSSVMLAKTRMFSFKFKNMDWKGNEVRYIFIGVITGSISGALLIKNLFVAAPIIILLYIIISMIYNLFRKKNEVQS